MNASELTAWLRLTMSDGVGPVSVRRLLAAYGSPELAVDAGFGGWQQVAGTAVANALQAAPPETLQATVDATLAWLAGSGANGAQPRHVITLGDSSYPAALLNISDPPPLLFAMGRLDLLQNTSLAIVGSRRATPQGCDNARAFAAHLSGVGLTIVSGMALGIDGAAHEGALRGPGSTIAVVGTGLDLVYPRRHRALAHRIAEEGLLLSEFWLGTESLSANFPRRNRVIAGLCRGTLVVEAAVQSGSLITARLAMEGGREVFAIPGSIHSPQSRGCHRLIKDGAKLVEAADDILQELNWGVATTAAGVARAADAPGNGVAEGSSAQKAVLDAMGHDPVTIDALGARTGWATEQLQVMLLELELSGDAARLPGGLYQRRSAA